MIHADPSKPFVLGTNTFDLSIGVVLSQLRKDNFFHPINFRSRKFFPTETNYKIHDKEFLTIMDAFEE